MRSKYSLTVEWAQPGEPFIRSRTFHANTFHAALDAALDWADDRQTFGATWVYIRPTRPLAA